MEKTLQYQFIESQGKPVQVGELDVFQCDRLAIKKGKVKLCFLNKATGRQGVALKAKKGGIKMSNGKKAQRLNIWHEKGLSPIVEHEVDCPTGELMVWNIYRVEHANGSITEDEWTGNAGMTILDERDKHRRYGCSDSLGEFSPDDLEFEIDWEHQG